MGQTLSEPVTEKETEEGTGDKYAYVVSSMQGWRVSMEDAHTTLLKVPGDNETSLFGVYDGHGGSSCAKFVSERIHEHLVGDLAYRMGDYKQALHNIFVAMDDEMRSLMRHDSSGAACVVLLMRDEKVYCANAGDSRAMMCVRGEQVELSHDHKPTNETERNRIVEAGGSVEAARVNGNLALSRALGDFEFKMNSNLPVEKQVVTCVPDIIEKDLSRDVDYFVICCDGIWDCMTNQEVADFITPKMVEKIPLTQIAEDLLTNCLAEDMTTTSVGCDNMTAIIIPNLMGKSYDKFCEYLAVRPDAEDDAIEDPAASIAEPEN